MTNEESIALAQATLAAAGWAPMPGWGGYVHGPCVGGVDPWKTPHFKSLEMIPPGHPLYGPDTPDEHHEAAAWLVEHAKRLRLEPVAPAPEAEETAAHETHGETGEETIVYAANSGMDSESEEIAPSTLENSIETEAEATIQGEFSTEGNRPVDADFTIPDLPEIELDPHEDYTLLEGGDADLGADLLEFEQEAAPEPKAEEAQPIMHMWGDSIHVMRWGKKGQLDEIARRRKRQILGEWSPQDFRDQQAQLSRFASGELGAGPEARAHFDRVAAIVATLDRDDRFHERRVLELDSTDFEFVKAFDPEEGWPEL